MTDENVLECLQGALRTWAWGFRFWGTIYYAGNSLAIILPILVATNLVPSGSLCGKALLAFTSIVVAIISWLQPGSKATGHEHAFIAVRALVTEYKAQLLTPREAMQAFRECCQFIDYNYLDHQPTPVRSSGGLEPLRKP